MAQDFAQLHRSRWSDADWRALSADAQWAYDMLLSHPDRNAAGLLPLTPKKWLKLSADMTAERLDRALAELDDAGFIVLDDETQEVLIRAFVRVAKIYKHIRMFTTALRIFSEVESERLRSAIGQELVRLPKLEVPEPNGRNGVAVAEAEQAQQRLDELASMLCDAPPDPPGHGAAHPMGHPMADATVHPMPHPPITVTGTGTALGSCSSFEKKSSESNARAKPQLSVLSNPGDDENRTAS